MVQKKQYRKKLQPRTKPVDTKPVESNPENAYLFLSSWQKLKPPPNECPISPLPLSRVVQNSMAIIRVGFQTKTTLNRGCGGGLLFLFRGDGSRAQKLENRWNCLNSFVGGCRNFHVTLKFWKSSLQVISTSNNYYIILYAWLLKKYLIFLFQLITSGRH